MNTTHKKSMARQPGSLCWLVSFLFLIQTGDEVALGAGLPTSPKPPTVALGAGLPTSPKPPTEGLQEAGSWSGDSGDLAVESVRGRETRAQRAPAHSVEPYSVGLLFDAPPPTQTGDEVLLISTREIGTVCSGQSMRSGLSCQRLVSGLNGSSVWKTTDWRRLLSSSSSLPTIIYVHGNRVSPGKDHAQGMQVYHSLKAHSCLTKPVRFIIWSWPSSKILGPVKDYLVKSQRTNPAAWQLAWVLDKLPVDAQISLVGYSFGTRVVSGAAHLLAGGRLGQLKLEERIHPQRPSVQAALIAAAFDADWVQPGQFYGRTLGQLKRLVLVTNEQDPVMRFYHLSNGRGRMHALGKSGVHQPRTLGKANRRLQLVDFSHEVGRSHALIDYLGANEKMRLLWQELLVSQDPAMTYVPPELVTVGQATSPFALLVAGGF